MSCEEETAELLRQAGHKLTPQRLLILRALRHAKGHVSASRIAEEVREQYPFVDVSTVYRTLDVLKRMRLVTETDMGAADAVFEWAAPHPHHHLICSSCGDVADLGHSYLESLADCIRTDFGFVADLHHFAIFGLCSDCKAAESADDDAP
ncbi:MAG: transcriptional repressor [Dehalococcoidia bacterium]|nr:transcriptional repressor [Dehalococcoidia bacterium]MCL4230150.1 transcriptional repressor [Dehalococcoidia bacterium]